MSQQLANLILSQYQINSDTNLTQKQKSESQAKSVKSLRQSYEENFQYYEKNFPGDAESWKKVFVETGERLTTNLRSLLSENKDIEDHQILFACNNQIYKLKQSVILVGRYIGCDIPLADPDDKTVSRLHAIIFVFSEYQKIFVVDVGSFDGIITKSRSSELPCISSLPEKRDIIVLDYKESVELIMGTTSFFINPKDCLICFQEPKNTKFLLIKENNIPKGCNHHAVCLQCSKKISKCPICRAEIVMAIEYIGADTQIN